MKYLVHASELSKYTHVLLDMDGTIYENTGYAEDAADRQWQVLASELSLSVEETHKVVEQRRFELSASGTSFSEVVYSFGFSPEWWSEIRVELCYFPEQFLRPDPLVNMALAELSEAYNVAIGTNTPHPTALRVLHCLDLSSLFPPERVFTPDRLTCSKPQPEFFTAVAQVLHVAPSRCVSVGDREHIDVQPARKIGMGGIVVDNVLELMVLIRFLLDNKNGVQPFWRQFHSF